MRGETASAIEKKFDSTRCWLTWTAESHSAMARHEWKREDRNGNESSKHRKPTKMEPKVFSNVAGSQFANYHD